LLFEKALSIKQTIYIMEKGIRKRRRERREALAWK